MKLYTILITLLLSYNLMAQTPSDPSFFANPEIQKLAPEAFAVQEKSIPFLKVQRVVLYHEVLKLVTAIRADRNLAHAISGFETLNLDQKTEVMKQTFTHITRALGILPPVLVLDNTFKNATYFDFDLNNPSPGRVILNPKDLAAMRNPYSPLLYLIHETKHSAQFQIAFSKRTQSSDILAKGYKAAFSAQKSLQGKLSFCDFLTLVNELDAFQFGNAVVGLLTGGKSNDETMGTLASQFDNLGFLKIDIVSLYEKHGGAGLIPVFNQLEIRQWKLIKKPSNQR